MVLFSTVYSFQRILNIISTGSVLEQQLKDYETIVEETTMFKGMTRERILKMTKTISIIALALFGFWLIGATAGNRFNHLLLPGQDTSEGSNHALSVSMDNYVKGWTNAYRTKMESSDNKATFQAATVTTHLTGSVVIVNPGKGQIVADLQSRLPSYLKPKNTKAVRIIVWVDHYTRATGTYSDGSSANTWFADQTFVDASTHEIMGYTELIGGDPPSYVYTNGSRTGSDISNKDIATSIVKWIQNTPNSN